TSLPTDEDRATQARTLVTATHNTMTHVIDSVDDYRTPLPADVRSYEITGAVPGDGLRFGFDEWAGASDPMSAPLVERAIAGGGGADDEGARDEGAGDGGAGDGGFADEGGHAPIPGPGRRRRLIDHSRVLYRPDDLGASVNDTQALLPLGVLEPRAMLGRDF